jgi:hypothetical protein
MAEILQIAIYLLLDPGRYGESKRNLALPTCHETDYEGFWQWCLTLGEYWVFGLVPSSGILKNVISNETNKVGVSHPLT